MNQVDASEGRNECSACYFILPVTRSRGSLIFSQPPSCGVYTQCDQLNCNPTSPTDKNCSASGTDQDGFLCSGSGILALLKPAEKSVNENTGVISGNFVRNWQFEIIFD